MVSSCGKEPLYLYQDPAFYAIDAGYDVNEGMLFVLFGFTCQADQEFEIKEVPVVTEVYHNGNLYKSLNFSTNLKYQPDCGNTRRLQLGHNGPGEYTLHYFAEVGENRFLRSQRVEIYIDFILK